MWSELPEIEDVRAHAQLPEPLAGDRVPVRAAGLTDADDERLRTGRPSGQGRTDNASIADGEVGVEGPLLDAVGLAAGGDALGDDRGPLLEVDADAEAESRVQAIHEAAIERAEGHFRLDRRGVPDRRHRLTIAQTGATDEGCRKVRSVDWTE